jgi:hypothetical protein
MLAIECQEKEPAGNKVRWLHVFGAGRVLILATEPATAQTQTNAYFDS